MKNFIYFIINYLIIGNVYADKIEKISVNGNVRISDKTVILFSKAKINQEVNEDDFNNFIKDFSKRFFKKVQIKFEERYLCCC